MRQKILTFQIKSFRKETDEIKIFRNKKKRFLNIKKILKSEVFKIF